MVYLVEGHILQEHLARGAKEHTIHEYAHPLTVKSLHYHPYRCPHAPLAQQLHASRTPYGHHPTRKELMVEHRHRKRTLPQALRHPLAHHPHSLYGLLARR